MTELTSPGTSPEYTPVHGSERKIVPGAEVIGPSDPAEVISVSIRLRPRTDGGELAALADAIGVQMPGARTYLSREEFAAKYGADPADMETVAEFAREHHLSVTRADQAQRVMVLSGTVAAVSSAFHVELIRYSSPIGEYRGRLGNVHIPSHLGSVVDGIFGLDNRRQARPHIILPATAERLRSEAGAHAAKRAESAVSYVPPQVGDLYSFPSNLDGSGQCIGLLEFGGGFSQSDIQSYFTQLNLPVPSVTAVSVDGTSNQPGADPNTDGEVMLDIEVAASLAPGASIVVYFAPFTEQGWVDAVSTAVHDTQHHPSVLSISWGYTEGQDIWTAQAVRAVNQAFQAAAVMGMTICAASGDDGSEDQLSDGRVHVDFPAASPYVLACGGTYLEVANGVRSGERVWNNGQRANGGGAGGGGISDMNALPSWQQGIVPPSANPDHHVGRGVPDVAGDADENSGYTILVDGQVASNVGGTSAVAPLWAALTARINQQLGKPVGYITPLLYTQLGKAGVLNDITTGNNDPTGGNLPGYSAGPGWDACTGWGTPNGTKLLEALAGSTSTGSAPGANQPIPVTPPITGTGVASQGLSGGSLAWGIILLIVVIILAVLGALVANHTL
jgi:kumamolisin